MPDVPAPSRRTVLRRGADVGLAVALLAVAGPVGGTVVAGCGRAAEEPDELEGPLAAARADAAGAAGAAAGFPDLAGRLTPVADTRRAHADALAAEVRRARPERAQVLDAAAPAASPDPAPAPADRDAALRAVRGGLAAAREAGTSLAGTTTRFRAGLLTSVVASCAGLEGTLA